MILLIFVGLLMCFFLNNVIMWYLFLKNVWHGNGFELETPVLYNVFAFIGETKKERERERGN